MSTCKKCKGTGMIDIMGDGGNFEWDVVDEKVCAGCEGLGYHEEHNDLTQCQNTYPAEA